MKANRLTTPTRWALAFQGLIIFSSISGVAVNLAQAETTFGRLNMFSYYTIQSNILVAVALGLGMWYMGSARPEPGWVVIFKSGALLWILVTGIVYNILLADRWNPQGAMIYVNLSLHYATPLGTALNWLFFEPKGQYRPSYVLAWMAYPLLYMLGSWVRGAVTGFYPYWFLNPTATYPQGAGSWGEMMGVVAVLIGGFLAGGWLILSMDWLAARRRRRIQLPEP